MKIRSAHVGSELAKSEPLIHNYGGQAVYNLYIYVCACAWRIRGPYSRHCLGTARQLLKFLLNSSHCDYPESRSNRVFGEWQWPDKDETRAQQTRMQTTNLR